MCDDHRSSLFMGPLCRVKINLCMYCGTVYTLTRVLFLYSFLPSLRTEALMATAWCGKSKFAISSRWHNNIAVTQERKCISSGWHDNVTVTHPDENPPQLSLPDDIKWKRMSSGWHNEFAVTHPDEIPTPGKSSGWLRYRQFLIRMT